MHAERSEVVKGLLILLLAPLAYADVIPLTCLTNNSLQCSSVASEIAVDGVGPNLVISNLGPLRFAIDTIYFDPTPDTAITGIVLESAQGKVTFEADCAPKNLPAGKTAIPSFVSLFCVSSTSNENRIDAFESLTLSATGGSLGDLVEDGFVRMGLHVQSIGASLNSDSLIAAGVIEPVPEPVMSAYLLVVALVSLELCRRQFAHRPAKMPDTESRNPSRT